MELMRCGRIAQGGPSIAVLGGLMLMAGVPLVSAQEPGQSQTTTLPSMRPGPDEITDRLGKMEEMNRKILEEIQKLSKENQALTRKNMDLSKQNLDLSHQYDDLSKKIQGLEKQREEKPDSGSSEKKEDGAISPSEPEPSPAAPSSGGARLVEEQVVGNRRLGKLKLNSSFNYERQGFQFETEDQEFELRLREEIQAESMIYTQNHQDPVHNGFYMPRMRMYFQGHMTKPIEYQLSIQRSYNTFAPLNAFLNFNYDQRFQIRFGRFKVPFTYEFYHLNNWRLIQPERSLFNVNFAMNRQIALMAWGELLDRRMEYAVSIADGPRNSFQDFNQAKDAIAFLNFRPFRQSDSFLRNLNFGGSVDYGNQDNPLRPSVLRTNVNASTSTLTNGDPVNNATVPFLAFNNNVREKGLRALWDLHLAYYYKGLSLLGAWDSGFDSYSQTGGSSHRPVRLPIGGYYVQAAYLLTGETINERTVVDPIRRFDLRPGHFGLGAFELTGRYSELNIGREVFNAGLADPNLWTNRAQLIDAGMNWYLNKWVKVYFDWEHAIFGSPVYYAPGPRLQKTSDLFWLRLQLYF
jgi:phosphate-selective porin OprO and OprP